MKIIQSARPSFRYLTGDGTNAAHQPPDIAGTAIALTHLELPEYVQQLSQMPRVQKAVEACNTVGTLDLVDLSESADYRFRATLREPLAPIFGRNSLPFCYPAIGVINSAVPYHVDMPMYRAIFGAWFIDGPERVLRFSEMGLEVPVSPGTFVLFDPAQPHALLRPGTGIFIEEDYTNPGRPIP